ncbi:MAG: DinB family protein [Solitalea sp.]
MKKSAIQIDTGYFSRYIELAGDGNLNEELENKIRMLDQLDLKTLERVGDLRYAPGKWTLKSVIQHMIDAERIFQYRALRFARGDRTPLHGFEQDDYAAAAETRHRGMADLMEEWRTVSQSSLALFRSLPKEALQQTGVASGNTLSVLALGFLIVGHQIHHLRIIRERYLPLAVPVEDNPDEPGRH